MAFMVTYLTKHCSFCFNTSNTPTSNSKPIDHSGVGICSDNTIRIEQAFPVEDDSSEVFKIHLTKLWHQKPLSVPEYHLLSCFREINKVVNPSVNALPLQMKDNKWTQYKEMKLKNRYRLAQM